MFGLERSEMFFSGKTDCAYHGNVYVKVKMIEL